ncbi:MAG: PAS domain S-box protein [SAR324 cluster bacterium]|nr:PAS domain S-box protein [SAR324 cluster bacterium]
MKDQDKSKLQLLAEIEELRNRLEASRQIKGFAEELMENTQTLLMEAQRVAKLGSWEYDLGSNTIVWSKEVYSIFGLDENYIPSLEGLADLIHPDDLWVISPETIKKNTEQGIQTMEYRIIDQTTGQTKYVIGRGETINDAEGKPLKNIGSFQDITESKLNEIALRESESRYRTIFETAVDGIVSIDEKGLISGFNPAAEKIFGYQLHEVLGKNIKMLMPSPFREEHDRYIKKYRQTGEKKIIGIGREVIGQRKDGSTFPMSLAVSEMQLEDRKCFNGIIRDITQSKNTEAELLLAKERSDSANRAKTQFLANMSHEIRTPLGAIIGFNQILIEQSRQFSLPDEFQEFLQNIKNSAAVLLELINNILDLSKIDAGKMELIEEDFQLEKMLEQNCTIYQFHAAEKGVSFHYELSPKLPPWIHSDRIKIQQILTNLVGNAIKFTPEGREVRLKVSGDHGTVAFSVIDQGIGIPQDRQTAVFEGFVQADDSTARNFGGTGLGLTISKKLVEMLGGKISVASPGRDQGSNFTFRIPIQAASDPFIGDQETAPQLKGSEASLFSNENLILVVEDNRLNQALIEALLRDFTFQIQFADDGRQGVVAALALHAKGKTPDLILMDVQMPVMDGIEATRQIRSHPDFQDVPIIALSANVFSEQREEAFAAGINAYLNKPIELDELLPVFKKYLVQNSQ